LHTVNRISKQIVAAIIISGLIVGSSLLIVAHMPPLWGETSALGIVGLIVAGFIGLGMLLDLNKGDKDDWSGWEE
jgi:ubiquinone biosynthesis protein